MATFTLTENSTRSFNVVVDNEEMFLIIEAGLRALLGTDFPAEVEFDADDTLSVWGTGNVLAYERGSGVDYGIVMVETD